MLAYVPVALALLLAPGFTRAAPSPDPGPDGPRVGYEREIDATRYNQVPKRFVLDEEYRAGAAAAAAAAHRNKSKLVTRPRPDAVVADDVVLESNSIRIVKPVRRKEEGGARRRRGYNLENVWVPARYPYLPVPSYTRFRRRG